MTFPSLPFSCPLDLTRKSMVHWGVDIPVREGKQPSHQGGLAVLAMSLPF